MKKLIKQEENEFFEFLKSDIDKTVFPVKYQIAGMFGNEKSWLSIGTMVFFNKKIHGEFNYFSYKGEITQSRINIKKYMMQYIFSKTSKEVESINSWYDHPFYRNLEVKLKNGETCNYYNREIISRLKNCIAFILNKKF